MPVKPKLTHLLQGLNKVYFLHSTELCFIRHSRFLTLKAHFPFLTALAILEVYSAIQKTFVFCVSTLSETAFRVILAKALQLVSRLKSNICQ